MRNAALASAYSAHPPAYRQARAALKPATRRTFDRLVMLGAAQTIALDAANDGVAYPRTKDGRERLDAQTLAIAARQLEHVMSEVYEEDFPDLRMANGDVIPIDGSIPEGAETFIYYLYSAVGVARFSSAYSSRTSPRATIAGAKVTGNVEAMEGSYGYTARDLRNASFANLPLETMLAVAERRAHMELLNKTGLWGREDLGLPGFVNHANITVLDAPHGPFSGNSVDEIIADVALVIDTAELVSFGMRKTNVVAFPRSLMLRLKTTRMGAGDGGYTVLKFLQEAFPGVSFEVLNELAAAQSDGNLAEDAILGYTRDARLASLIVPMPFRQYPVQQEGLEFRVPCESSTGGVKMPEPMIVTRMDGV